MIHRWTLRVYYEDTDLAGLVYYANYLRFIERARSELVREVGIDQTEMKAKGIVFAVRRVEADYLSPARYDDFLEICTEVVGLKRASFDVRQTVRREEKRLFEAVVRLVILDETGRPMRIPAEFRAKLAGYMAD